MLRTALFSLCRRFRYRLGRRWAEGSAVCFVLLNPSTADEVHDDPTVRRCIDFARRWGYGGLEWASSLACSRIGIGALNSLPSDLDAASCEGPEVPVRRAS